MFGHTKHTTLSPNSVLFSLNMEAENDENASIINNNGSQHKELINGTQNQALTDIIVLHSAASDTDIPDVQDHPGKAGGASIGSSCSSTSRPIPPFLLKLYDMLSNEETNSFVSWSPAGTSFVIRDHHAFAANVLPMYFRHNNFQSFITQLNSYGFRKVSHEQWEYRNEYFQKGERHLLRSIKRRSQILHTMQPGMKPSFDASPGSGGSSNNEYEFLMKEHGQLKAEMVKLTEKQQTLEEKLILLKYQVASNERDQSRMTAAAQRILCNLRDLSSAQAPMLDDDGRETHSKGKRKLDETLCSDVPAASCGGCVCKANIAEVNHEILLEGEEMGKHQVNTFISLEDLIRESSTDCVEYVRDLQEKASHQRS